MGFESINYPSPEAQKPEEVKKDIEDALKEGEQLKENLPTSEQENPSVLSEASVLGIPKEDDSKQQSSEKKDKIVFVDVSEAIEKRARDVAESKLTASKEELSGVKGFVTKIWKHNLFHEYYRQKEISLAKNRITESGNIYIDEGVNKDAHVDAMNAITERFTYDYNETLHKEAGEKREVMGEDEKSKAIKVQINEAIKNYASGNLDDENFIEEKNRIFSQIKGNKIDNELSYTDNLFEIAKQIKLSVEQGQKLEDLKLDLDVVVGNAKTDVRTEAQFNAIDRIVEKIQGSKIGRFANEATIASAVSIAYSLTAGVSKKMASSRLFAVGSFGATAALTAGVAGLREAKRLEEERRQHAREMAQGKTFDSDKAPRRKEMEEFRHETKDATDLANALEESLYKFNEETGQREVKKLSQEELQIALSNLAEIESRIILSDRQNIDLISYSNVKKVERERLRLDILRYGARADLQKIIERNPEFNYSIEGLLDSKEIKDRLETPDIKNEQDEKEEKNKLAYWLSEMRLIKGYKIDDIEKNHGSFTDKSSEEYAKWDWCRIEEILKAKNDSENKLVLPDNKPFADFMDALKETKIEHFIKGDQGLEKKNELFKKMKHRNVAKAALKGLATGLIIGGTVQEISAFLREGQEGFVEGLIKGHGAKVHGITHVTAVEGLRRWVTGNSSMMEHGNMHEVAIGANHFKLPEGVKLVGNSDGSYSIFRGNDVVSEGIKLNYDGSLSEASKNILHQSGVEFNSAVKHVNETITENVIHNPQELVQAHNNLAHEVSREMWYDNDTSIFNKNELKLWWGGSENAGIDSNGNYIFDVKHMTPDGSFHKDFSVNAVDAIKEGKLKLILSLSQNTQKQVFDVPIDVNGNAVIDPNSEVGKMFFQNVDGHAKFLGRFAEVVEVVGKEDNVDQVRVLATHVGEGIKGIGENITTNIPKDIPTTIFDIPADYRIDPPPIIPIFGRKPLEPAENRKLTDITSEYYYGSGIENGLLDRGKYKERMSSKILENKDIDLSGNDSEIIKEYFSKQDKKYISELENLVSGSDKMDKNIEAVITVPAYQEGKNLEKTLRNYAKINDRGKFEIVILENHPKDKERDNSIEAINKIKAEFPDLKITHLYKVFDQKPTIGEVRKHLVDSVLLRKQMADIKKSIAIISNDADLENISEEYINSICDAFENNKKIDAIGAKWDFPADAFEKFPLLHASQRLWQYIDIVFRNKYLKSPELIGRNSAFRSGSYAAVGGYNEKAKVAEDLEIGWLIKDARGYDAERITYLNKAWLVSNPRRAVTRLTAGGRLVEQYGDFHVNEEVRKASLEELLKDKKDFNEEDFEKEVQGIYDHYQRFKKSKGGWLDDEDIIDNSFNRAMGFLGVKYKIKKAKENGTAKDIIDILDTSSLMKGLKSYPERVKKINRAKEIIKKSTKKNNNKETKKNVKKTKSLSKARIDHIKNGARKTQSVKSRRILAES